MINTDAEDKSENMTILKTQKIAGHYVIQEKIGQGGMGEIFLALDERLERQVAIFFWRNNYGHYLDQ